VSGVCREGRESPIASTDYAGRPIFCPSRLRAQRFEVAQHRLPASLSTIIAKMAASPKKRSISRKIHSKQ
jgi:hypothetical protein